MTFDVDFFDGSLVPGTGTPEPGGGTYDQALSILRRVASERQIIGADVVEHAPLRRQPGARLHDRQALLQAARLRLLSRKGPKSDPVAPIRPGSTMLCKGSVPASRRRELSGPEAASSEVRPE